MERRQESGVDNFGTAWISLCLALCAHVADEALTGFLGIYNPTVLAARELWPWFPMPTFEFRGWLSGLIFACVALLLLSLFAFQNSIWLRPLAYFFAVIMFMNGMGHTLATIFGQTFSSIHFSRPAPGFYSSPLLFAGSIYLFVRLRATRRISATAS